MRSLSQCLPRQADPRGDFPEQAQGNGVALARAFWQAIASCSISAVSLSWDSSPSPQTMPRSRARFHRIRSALVVAMNPPSQAVTVAVHKTDTDLAVNRGQTRPPTETAPPRPQICPLTDFLDQGGRGRGV
ncbi:hypothetical protein [Acidithiobacillus ferriphilus]|uniref:hypothetical protein n=1 Tax=Acidithiobacillus ferriphilus TaxID=1689834 RepID=UPI002DBE2A99|nr:hypothetical protein [Acidithiobacillus ferriphilus]